MNERQVRPCSSKTCSVHNDFESTIVTEPSPQHGSTRVHVLANNACTLGTPNVDAASGMTDASVRHARLCKHHLRQNEHAGMRL